MVSAIDSFPETLLDGEPPGDATPVRSGRPRLGRARVASPTRLGLQARAALTLALGALLVSVAVAALTFLVARRSLLNERRSVVEKVVYNDAIEVQSVLSRDITALGPLLRRKEQVDLSAVVFSAQGTFTSNQALSERVVPDALRQAVRGSQGGAQSAYQVIRHGPGAKLVIGVPLRAVNGEYYGIASLTELDRRLQSLRRTLTLAALVSSLGAALIGRSVMKRVMRPLSDVAAGASDIGRGRLDTRLALTGDTDLDPLLVSFNDMAKTLQERIEREARFASDVSHELRTPLTALITAARLLDGRRDELSERSQKTLDVLVMQSAHFERLVLDLLEISRFDAGAVDLNAEVVHLPELCRNILRLNGCDAPVTSDDLDPPEVSVDKRRVDRMLANLVQNAANYAGGAIAVTLSDCDRRPSAPRRVRIAVDDAGPGIAPDEREVLFERFRRGQSQQRIASAPKGTGLGLALVRAHAQLHGGDVWVEDRTGGGARFVVEIEEADEADET